MKKKAIQQALMSCQFVVSRKGQEIKTINLKKLAEIFGPDGLRSETGKHKVKHQVFVGQVKVAQFTTRDGKLLAVQTVSGVKLPAPRQTVQVLTY